jgi:hypothetical protein
MRQDQIRGQVVQRVEPGGIITDPRAAPLVTWGLHGASNFVIGIQIGETVLERLPGEEVDALRVRAMIDVVPNLPPDTLRDSKGSAVGFFRYDGLPSDHCKQVAEQQASL